MDYNRKFKCKYCDYRGNREELVNHIEHKHSEFVSDQYPASRIVYNYLNNVETGKCVICGKSTKWNDKTWKYYRHCGSEKCKEKIKEAYRKNAIAAKGTYNFTKDPKHLEKMLAGRKISGVYTCSNGAKKTYTGSYERKAIEFMDKVLKIDPDDVMMPGPIIQYEYNGEVHSWITDIYYIPYNLIIEVKDGGDNPNKREMAEYREKQIAKEKAIISMNQYNYLRLTNNNFVQLIQMFSSLRIAMINDTEETRKAIIQINEEVKKPVCNNDKHLALVFVYSEFSNAVTKVGLTDLSSDYCIIPESGILVEKKMSEIYNKTKIYYFKETPDVSDIVYKFKNKKTVHNTEIFESILNKKFRSDNQIILETNLIPSEDNNHIFSELTQNSLDRIDTLGYDGKYINGLNEPDLNKLENHNIALKNSSEGYYLETTDIYPALSTKPTMSLYDTISQIDSFILLVNRCGGCK